MPLTGDAKREYMRLYMRTIRARAREAGKLVSAAVQATQRRQQAQPVRVENTVKTVLGLTLVNKGLTLDRVCGKIADKLEAKRHQTVAGKAMCADDNDAQLRATEQAIRLHERAGTIPAQAQSTSGNMSLTVIEVNYHDS
jgi:hypothetical protein